MSVTVATPAEAGAEEPPDQQRHRLTALGGLSALSPDAMASVAYGPEPVVPVPTAAGSYGLGFTLPVTVAIAVLPAVLVASYRQVIAAFPDGGGSYAVAKAHLGRRTALTAAASLVIDHVLNVAVSVTNGVAALGGGRRVTVPIPEVEPARVWQRALRNQRGAVIDRALRRRTDATVCRLRLRMRLSA